MKTQTGNTNPVRINERTLGQVHFCEDKDRSFTGRINTADQVSDVASLGIQRTIYNKAIRDDRPSRAMTHM